MESEKEQIAPTAPPDPGLEAFAHWRRERSRALAELSGILLADGGGWDPFDDVTEVETSRSGPVA